MPDTPGPELLEHDSKRRTFVPIQMDLVERLTQLAETLCNVQTSSPRRNDSGKDAA